jgi:hypothetical protein
MLPGIKQKSINNYLVFFKSVLVMIANNFTPIDSEICPWLLYNLPLNMCLFLHQHRKDKHEPNSSVTSCDGASGKIDKIKQIPYSLTNVRKVRYKPDSNLSI